MKQRNNSAAIYCRLSRDDGNDSESNSIATQRAMLQRYAKEQGFVVFSEYIDDGISGTTFERDGFRRMISDIEDGKIGIVICKDLSRFGRNNALVAYYTELVFPEADVRFIAVNDCIDTALGDSGGNAIMPFMSVVNEYYARDISKKVRSAKKTRALNGEHCAGRAPYGYIKDPNNRRRLIIDEETAPTVRRIFEMCASGMGNYKIAYQLANDKVLTPSELEYRRTGNYGCYCDPDFPWDWKARTVYAILKNPMYLGHMVSLRSKSKSFKSKKNVAVPKEEWVTVENTHAAIISQELFDKVQTISETKKRTNKLDLPNKFAGLIFCHDCERKLSLHLSNGRNLYYVCGGYRRGSRAGEHRLCTPHTTKLLELEELTLTLIQMAVKATLDVDKFVERLLSTVEKDDSEQKTLARLKRRDAELKILTKRVFEQNALGKIDDDTFANLYGGYNEEQKDLDAKIDTLERRLSEVKSREARARQFAEAVAKYTGATELTQEMVTDLIEKVMAHEPVGTKMQNRSQTIDIYFRFIGQLPDIFFDGAVSL